MNEEQKNNSIADATEKREFNWTPEEVEKVVVRDFNAAITTFLAILQDRELLTLVVDRLCDNMRKNQEAEEEKTNLAQGVRRPPMTDEEVNAWEKTRD